MNGPCMESTLAGSWYSADPARLRKELDGYLRAAKVAEDPTLFAAVMLAPVAGHAFSPLKRFHGGKGIAVSFGVLLALIPKRLIVLVLAGMYLCSLLLPLHPNEKRTVAAFSAFAAIALLIEGPFSVKLGCLLIALLVNYKNWRDAQISLSLFRHK